MVHLTHMQRAEYLTRQLGLQGAAKKVDP